MAAGETVGFGDAAALAVGDGVGDADGFGDGDADGFGDGVAEPCGFGEERSGVTNANGVGDAATAATCELGTAFGELDEPPKKCANRPPSSNPQK